MGMRMKGKFTATVVWVAILAAMLSVLSDARAESNPVLDNGFVRLTFDPQHGQFELQPAGTRAMVLTGGPGVEVDGRKISASEASHVRMSQETFTDELGAGQKLI